MNSRYSSGGSADHPIIVIGMHRSGTSMLAKILRLLNVAMGEDLNKHHESRHFIDINNALLASSGGHWAAPRRFLERLENDEFVEMGVELASRRLAAAPGYPVDRSAWGWKDPRSTLTLPIWLRIFPAARVVFIIRNGVDVALSVQRRELRHLRMSSSREEPRIFPPTLRSGLKLWRDYNRAAAAARPSTTEWLSLRYEDIVTDPVGEVEALASFLGREPPSGSLLEEIKNYVSLPTDRTWSEKLRVRALGILSSPASSELREFGYSLV